MNKIVINGTSFNVEDNSAIAITNGQVIINGDIFSMPPKETHDLSLGNQIHVTLKCDGNLSVTGNINGDVNAGGNIVCANIAGDVFASQSISCNNISGDVKGGEVKANKIVGDVMKTG